MIDEVGRQAWQEQVGFGSNILNRMLGLGRSDSVAVTG
jgi:hypothetical protein